MKQGNIFHNLTQRLMPKQALSPSKAPKTIIINKYLCFCAWKT